MRQAARGILDYMRKVVDSWSGAPSPHAGSHLRTSGASDPLRTPTPPLSLGPNTARSVGSGGAPADEAHVHAMDLLLSAKGDLLSHNGSLYVRVALSGTPGNVPTEAPAEPAGWKWDTPSGGGGGSGTGADEDAEFLAWVK